MARIAARSSILAARMDMGAWVSGCELASGGSGMSGLRSRLRKDFGIGTADVVSIQIFGTNSSSTLDVLPAKAGVRFAVGISDVLAWNASHAQDFGKRGIGRNNTCPVSSGFGEKFFAGQQSLAVHARQITPKVIFADVDFAPARVERRQHASSMTR